MTRQEIENALVLHELWMDGYAGGIRADFSYMDLSKQDLSKVDLSEAILIGTNFADCILDDACLTSAKAYGANFCRASMKATNLAAGNFKGANFNGSDLSFANLASGNFTGAYFIDTKLYHCVRDFSVGLPPEEDDESEIEANVNIRVKVKASNLEQANECLEYELKFGLFCYATFISMGDLSA